MTGYVSIEVNQHDAEIDALHRAESILSLLHHRGIVDSEHNREDVASALTEVRGVLGIGGTYWPRPMPVIERRRHWWQRR